MAHVNFADDGQAPFDEDEGVVETDPTGRFSRYDEAVGQGTFKRVFKVRSTSKTMKHFHPGKKSSFLPPVLTYEPLCYARVCIQ